MTDRMNLCLLAFTKFCGLLDGVYLGIDQIPMLIWNKTDGNNLYKQRQWVYFDFMKDYGLVCDDENKMNDTGDDNDAMGSVTNDEGKRRSQRLISKKKVI